MTARRTYHRLRDLMDVLVSSPSDGEVLTYSSAAGKWENQAGGGGGSQAVQVATVTLSSAQILALDSVPITLVAAPGAGKCLHFASVFAQYRAGATPYTVGGVQSLSVFYNGGANYIAALFVANPAPTDGMGAATNAVMAENEGQGLTPLQSEAENKALELRDPDNNLSAGNGSLVVSTFYSVIDLL